MTFARRALPVLVSAALLIGCGSSLGAGTTATRGRTATTTHTATTARGCKKVEIGSHRQCLIAGHPCDRRFESQYERHGFRCRRNAAGQYRLWQPIKSTQPKP
jgi:hypothetical protein